MRVTWYVDDGYVGRDAPHYTDIPDDELADCESDLDREALINDYIEEDFRQNVFWVRK